MDRGLQPVLSKAAWNFSLFSPIPLLSFLTFLRRSRTGRLHFDRLCSMIDKHIDQPDSFPLQEAQCGS